MGIPLGLTDISIHVQTAQEKAESNRAMERKDYARMDDLKSAVILHFGERKVRLSTSTRSIYEATKLVSDIQTDIKSGRVKIEAPEIDTRPTAWMKLDSIPED